MLCNSNDSDNDNIAIFRPPDIPVVVGGLIFYQCFVFFFFIFSPPISELAKRNSRIPGHMVGSKCNLIMHVRNLGYPLPLK